MKLVWTTEAREQLRDIREYIALDNPRSARELILRLKERAEQLCLLPELGRQVPEYPGSAYRELLERPYRLFYIVDDVEQHVYILSVMHYRQRMPKRPRWQAQ